jgi:UDPglucose 6-dehydrogenase
MADKVCVIGIWHLGAVYSACLADLGYRVVGVERDAKKVAELNKGIPPLFEPGLQELLTNNIKSRRLSYTTDLSYAVKGARYVLITFDTPVNDQDEIDLSEIFDTANRLAGCLENNTVTIVSSQVPVGTCEEIKSLIKKKSPALDIDIAYSPENLRLGQAIDCFRRPERIVIGANSDATLDRVEALFSVVKAPILRMNLRSAEMTKHALNAFLATSISFGNEIANLCDEVGADALKVATALLTEGRIGGKIPLFPGLGFAGGTLARDLKVLKKIGSEKGYETLLIDSVFAVNQRQNGIVVRKLERIHGSVKGLTIGILGLTYKPGTSTLRRSAALEIIEQLVDRGAKVRAYDPKADLSEVKEHVEFEFCDDVYAVAKNSDALVLITEWPDFKGLNYDRLKSEMKKPVFIDTKNLLDNDKMSAKGFSYFGIGRGK